MTPAGVDRDRVVQVIARSAETQKPTRLGSGYLAGGGLVLTAAHVVRDADRVTVRRVLGPHRVVDTDADVAWSADPEADADLAVLRIAADPADAAGFPASVAALRFGRVERPVNCEAVGFPLFKMRGSAPGAPTGGPELYRDSHHAEGRIAPFSDMRRGTLQITVEPPGDGPDPAKKKPQWGGMSGAAVFADGALVGLVSEHHPADGPGRLAARRVEYWYELEPGALAELRALLDLPERDQLARVGLEAHVTVNSDGTLEIRPAVSGALLPVPVLPGAGEAEPVGRDREIDQAVRELTDGRIVQLYGPHRVGKKAVLHAALGRLGAQGERGHVLYWLESEKPTLENVYSHLVRVLFGAGALRAEGSILYAAAKDLRIVIAIADLDLAANEMTQLLRTFPRCRFLITSKDQTLFQSRAAIHVECLPRQAGIELVARQLGAPPQGLRALQADRAFDLAGGKPQLLLQLAAFLDTGYTNPDIVTPANKAVLLAAGLHEPARRALVALAVLDTTIPVGHLPAVTGLPPDASAPEPLIAAGLATASAAGLRITEIAKQAVEEQRWDLLDSGSPTRAMLEAAAADRTAATLPAALTLAVARALVRAEDHARALRLLEAAALAAMREGQRQVWIDALKLLHEVAGVLGVARELRAVFSQKLQHQVLHGDRAAVAAALAAYAADLDDTRRRTLAELFGRGRRTSRPEPAASAERTSADAQATAQALPARILAAAVRPIQAGATTARTLAYRLPGVSAAARLAQTVAGNPGMGRVVAGLVAVVVVAAAAVTAGLVTSGPASTPHTLTAAGPAPTAAVNTPPAPAGGTLATGTGASPTAGRPGTSSTPSPTPPGTGAAHPTTTGTAYAVPPGSPPPNGAITLDLGRTSYAGFYFTVSGASQLLTASQPHTFILTPGSYYLGTNDGNGLIFSVTANHLLDYDASLDSYVTGRGTSTLAVTGVQITVDARQTSYTHFVLSYATIPLPTATVQTLRMLPGALAFTTQDGTGVPAHLSASGIIDYDPSLDGVYSGRGTSTLIVTGVQIIVDARQTSYSSFRISALDTWPSASSPQTFRVLPGNSAILTRDGHSVAFRISPSDTVDYDSSLNAVLSGRGTSTLIVTGVQISVDARALSAANFYIANDTTTSPTTTVASLRITPGDLQIATLNGDQVTAQVQPTGTIGYNQGLNQVLSGRGTSTLIVNGVAITVDATSSPYTMFALAFTTPNWIDAHHPWSGRVLPGPQNFVTPPAHPYQFTISNTGSIDFEASLNGMFSGRGTGTLVVT